MKLTKRDKKLLAIAGAAVGFYLLYLFGLQPLIAYSRELSEEKQALQFNYEKSVQSLAQRAALESELNQVKSIGATQIEKLIPATNANVAGAKLQQTLDGYLQRAHLQTRSKKIMKPEEKGGFLAIAVELSTTGTLSDFRQFLTSVMNDKMLLQVKKLDIRPENQRDPHKIFVDMVIVGFIVTEMP